MKGHHGTLVLIIVLLLLQFALRIHHPLALPAYVDEASHIERAKIVYHFDQNPTLLSHGKLLYYYWLGLFAPGDYGELIVSRWAMALFSLITSAALAAIAQLLAGRHAAVFAVAFYALAPYALFFERMALADPFAGGLAALVVWHSLRLAHHPSGRRGAVVGLLAALMTLAKMTTAFVIFMPAAAILARHGLPRCRKDWAALWSRYRRPLMLAGVIFGAIWLVVLSASWYERLVNRRDAVLFDTYLVDQAQTPERFAVKLDETLTAARLMLSEPMTWGLIGLAILLPIQRPAWAAVILSWLGLLWLPSILLSMRVQPRYLMAGIPAIAVLFGCGVVLFGAAIERRMPRRIAAPQGLAAALLVAWAVGFALPFAYHAATDPTRLTLTEKDSYNYFHGMQNGWGMAPALDYLAAHGERFNDRVPLALVVFRCSMYRMHSTALFEGDCLEGPMPPRAAPDRALWDAVGERLSHVPFLYVITDYLGPDAAPPVAGSHWELVTQITRPHGGQVVSSVWRVTRSEIVQETP